MPAGLTDDAPTDAFRPLAVVNQDGRQDVMFGKAWHPARQEAL